MIAANEAWMLKRVQQDRVADFEHAALASDLPNPAVDRTCQSRFAELISPFGHLLCVREIVVHRALSLRLW